MRLKIYISLISLAIAAGNLPAQNLYNLPESVVYDSLYNRYLVSNWESGHIVELDSADNQSYWVSNQQCFAGLHIDGEILYVACREYGVKGFNLHTAEQVLNVPIPGASNINDIITDDSGNIFVSYPTGSLIYRVDIETQTYYVFVNSGILTPNGMYFDRPNNRIVLVSYRMNSPVQAISLEDSSVTTLPAVTIHNLDGIARDNEGNWYVSSWFYNAVYRFDPDFLNPPELIASFNDDPADIHVNLHNNILTVPLFFTSQVEFVQIEPSTVENIVLSIQASLVLLSAYPNPFNNHTIVEMQFPRKRNINLAVYDIGGRQVAILADGVYSGGVYKFVFDGATLTGGVYLLRLHSEYFITSSKLVFLK